MKRSMSAPPYERVDALAVDRRREQHLAAVPGARDPRSQVDVLADVALLGQVGRAGV
jgi:hypothetical protein